MKDEAGDAAQTAQAPETPRGPGRDSRREAVVEAAAKLFAARGFDGVSMRDIARGAGMLSGSLYYHFASKEALYAEVHATAVAHVTAHLDAALAACAGADPWTRLEAALRAHLEALHEGPDGVALMSPEFPAERADLARELAAQRDAYEARFGALIEACKPRAGVDRRLLRLLLLGGLNWTPVWWRPGRGAELGEVAAALTDLVRRGAA